MRISPDGTFFTFAFVVNQTLQELQKFDFYQLLLIIPPSFYTTDKQQLIMVLVCEIIVTKTDKQI
jgi:hypothetical protein